MCWLPVTEERAFPFSLEVSAKFINWSGILCVWGKIFTQQTRNLGASKFSPSIEWVSDLNLFYFYEILIYTVTSILLINYPICSSTS